MPASSGCVTTTTNAADCENADPNREADWLAAAMRVTVSLSLSPPVAPLVIIATLPLLSVTAAVPLPAN